MLNESQMWWLFGFSVFTFVATLLAVPWLVVRIPADYFSHPRPRSPAFLRDRPVLHGIIRVLLNVIGVVLILAGVLMLVLPGQGILTMVVGLLLTSFPGKHRLGRWLVSRRWLRPHINRIRRRADRPPLVLD